MRGGDILQFIKYCIVGVLLTGFLLVSQSILSNFFPYFFADLIVYFLGVSFGFFAHSSFSFRGKRGRFGSFLVVSIVLSLLSLSFAQFLRLFIGLDGAFYFYGISPSFFVSLFFYAVMSFFVNKSYVFSS